MKQRHRRTAATDARRLQDDAVEMKQVGADDVFVGLGDADPERVLALEEDAEGSRG